MSFQLTVQLPPGQCWKVIKQTDTKVVFAKTLKQSSVQLYLVSIGWYETLLYDNFRQKSEPLYSYKI